MARKAEPGISYYRMNCGHSLNKKVRLLFNEFDSNGYWIWQCILDHAYDHKGYYFDCNNADELELFATDVCKKPVQLVNDVISGCIRRNLFNKDLFEKHLILTSVMMQEIYFDATKERRRKGTSIEVMSDFLLITMSESDAGIVVVPRKNEDVPWNNEQIPRQNPDSIVEDSKGEKSKGEDKKGAKAPRTQKVFTAPDISTARKYFLESMGNPTAPGCWPADKCRMQADLFWTHYDANGWIQNKGKPVKIWKSAAAGWILRAIQGIYEQAPKNYEKKPQVSPALDITKPRLDEMAVKLNYFFGRFIEDPENYTLHTAEVEHYNFLKKAGLLEFTIDKTNEIATAAEKVMVDRSIPHHPEKLKSFMKKIGVIEFFKILKSSGKEAIFS